MVREIVNLVRAGLQIEQLNVIELKNGLYSINWAFCREFEVEDAMPPWLETPTGPVSQ